VTYAVIPEVSFSASNTGSSTLGHGNTSTATSTSWGAGWLVGAAGALLAAVYVLVALLCARSRRRRKEASLASSATNSADPMSHPDPGDCHSDLSTCCSESGRSSASGSPVLRAPSPASPLPPSPTPTSSFVAPRRVAVQVHGSEVPPWDSCSGDERLPEEDVSIVETPEPRDDSWSRREGWSLEAAPAPPFARKKLYFNPAYFEPDLLLVRFNLHTVPVKSMDSLFFVF